jgi:hypothetical protein
MIVGGQARFGCRLHIGACSVRQVADARRDGWPCEEGPTFNERIQAGLPGAGHQRGH